jgi:N-acylneuraminate cytidylyltransferase
MNQKKLAIITARSGSKRIPKKNIKDFFGKSIIAYSIEAAIGSKIFDEVMVSTDSDEIADIARKYGAKIPFMRSKKNSDDFSTTADVIYEVLTEYKKINQEFDIACCIYPTAVFVNEKKLTEAYKKLVDFGADSLVPVVKFSFPIQRSLKIEDNLLQFIWPENMNKRSQDLQPSYHDCGQFYFLNVKKFLEQKMLFTKNTVAFEISESEVQDIDNEEDWKIAEIKYQILQQNGK